MASLFRPTFTDKKTGQLRKTKKWYGRSIPGHPRSVPLSANKTVAQQMLNELVRRGEFEKVGIANPFEAHQKRPLAEHLAEWESALHAKGVSAKQVGQVLTRTRHVLSVAGFVFMRDVNASRVQEVVAELRKPTRRPADLPAGADLFTKGEAAALLGVKPSAVVALVRRHRLAAEGGGPTRRFPRATIEALQELRRQGRSVQTANFYLAAVKQFFRWLVRDRRAPDNPLAHVSAGNVRVDRRHDRQTLDADQLSAILDAALRSTANFRGLTGADRHYLYLTAMVTGFRRSELASLAPEWFALDADLPTVGLAASDTKNKQAVTQPMPADAAEALRGYLADKVPGQPVWPGGWAGRAADMLRIDLDAAGIAYVVDGQDGPLYADFHSLRHSYVAMLDRAGLTLKQMMQLARHSDPRLTAARYGRARLHDLGEAVERMPSLRTSKRPTEAVKATGTAGAACTPACTSLVQAADRDRVRVRTSDGGARSGCVVVTPAPERELRVFEEGCGEEKTVRPAGFEPATLGLGNRCSIP